MGEPVVDILMYHSISDSGGPTSIPAAVFAGQMAAIAEAGVPVIRLDDLLAAQAGGVPLPAQSVILTFDDGFLDFADTAFPILQRHGFSAMVYLPTRHVGHSEAWRGANDPPRPLVGWDGVRDLAAAGIDFGSHTVSHTDLCSLSEADLESELARSRAELEDRLGRRIDHFAPPYGRATPAIRARIARHYRTSVATRLDRARGQGDLHDLPRLEMFYFTAAAPWRRHLRNRGGAYLAARKALRAVRDAISKPWERP
jgi:peptidoglycan/xylan/chitin deacetylase (PgdA/CDA1 family)